MRKPLLQCMLFCLGFSAISTAQTLQLSGFEKFSHEGISPIYEGSEVKGYTVFYKADKADNKNANYGLSVYDENLKEVKTIVMQKPKDKYALVDNANDGNVLAFYYYNLKEKRFEMDCYDKGLVLKASVKIDHELTNMEEAMLPQKISANEKSENSDMYPIGLHAVPGKGFITDGMLKNGKGYSLDMYDESLKVKWHYTTDEKKKEMEVFTFSEITDKYILGIVTKRAGMMSTDVTYYVIAIDVVTGKKVLEVPVESDAHERLAVSSVTYEEGSNQLFVIGDYYDEKAKAGFGKSLGYYTKSFSMDGKMTGKKLLSWDKDINPKLPPQAKESLEKGAMNCTHKILRGNDGKFYFICEQFSKAGGTGLSSTNIYVWNFIIYVLNPDLTLADVKFYPKEKTKINILSGMGNSDNPGILAGMTKLAGGFDYQFSQVSNDRQVMNVVSVNYDKEKGGAVKRTISNISIAAGKFEETKTEVTTDATSSYLYPAKTGYIMMADYHKKEKTIELRLIALN